jgi:hypothetical protein
MATLPTGMTTESISSRLLDIGLNVSTGCGLDAGERGNASRFALKRVIRS